MEANLIALLQDNTRNSTLKPLQKKKHGASTDLPTHYRRAYLFPLLLPAFSPAFFPGKRPQPTGPPEETGAQGKAPPGEIGYRGDLPRGTDPRLPFPPPRSPLGCGPFPCWEGVSLWTDPDVRTSRPAAARTQRKRVARRHRERQVWVDIPAVPTVASAAPVAVAALAAEAFETVP